LGSFLGSTIRTFWASPASSPATGGTSADLFECASTACWQEKALLEHYRGEAGVCEMTISGGRTMRRFGQVIGLKPDRIEEYEAIHREVWPGVLELIHKHNIRNYSIFRNGTTLFACFEYVGDDFEADMAAMSTHPTNLEWWKLTEPMQVPLADREEGEWWKSIPEVFHTD
jgi:L-rhamnose mutarotase